MTVWSHIKDKSIYILIFLSVISYNHFLKYSAVQTWQYYTTGSQMCSYRKIPEKSAPLPSPIPILDTFSAASNKLIT